LFCINEPLDQGQISGDKCSTGNNGSIGDKGPFINTEQGKISGDNDPVGNKGYIGTKGPPINAEQGTISGDKGSTGNLYFMLNLCHLKFYLVLYK
jgi:hypothetical protein